MESLILSGIDPPMKIQWQYCKLSGEANSHKCK